MFGTLTFSCLIYLHKKLVVLGLHHTYLLYLSYVHILIYKTIGGPPVRRDRNVHVVGLYLPMQSVSITTIVVV